MYTADVGLSEIWHDDPLWKGEIWGRTPIYETGLRCANFHIFPIRTESVSLMKLPFWNDNIPRGREF